MKVYFFKFSYDHEDYGIFQFAFCMIKIILQNHLDCKTIVHHRKIARFKIRWGGNIETFTELTKSLSRSLEFSTNV